jgi:hypothetical protein
MLEKAKRCSASALNWLVFLKECSEKEDNTGQL